AASLDKATRLVGISIGIGVVAQFFLGAWAIWTHKDPTLTSLHVVLGAALLATSFLLMLRAYSSSKIS
ncbi:MAG: hypothetical protein KDD42_04865, partial [Bdellovibrionales bacterium]|nr:hypothetical protein [Bdellovibrionales bacterium]